MLGFCYLKSESVSLFLRTNARYLLFASFPCLLICPQPRILRASLGLDHLLGEPSSFFGHTLARRLLFSTFTSLLFNNFTRRILLLATPRRFLLRPLTG